MPDSSVRATFTAHGDAAHTARAMRKAELPLAVIRRQVMAEQYQEWRKWEEKQDFSTVMQGRYGLEVQEGLWSDTQGQVSTSLPLRDYWTARLNPQKRERVIMDLLKISVSKDARIDRTALYGRMTAEPLLQGAVGFLPNEKHRNDAIRAAVAYHCRQWKRGSTGAECRVVRKAMNGSKGLDLRVRIEELPDEAERHIAIIKGVGTEPVSVTFAGTVQAQFPELYALLKDVHDLEQFGAANFFETDLRKLCEKALESVCVPFWDGVVLCLTAEGYALAMALKGILETLDVGVVTIRDYCLDDTPANKEKVALQIGEGFIEELGKLQELTAITAPNMPSVRAKYEALCVKIALCEERLGDMGTFEAQVNLEMALQG